MLSFVKNLYKKIYIIYNYYEFVFLLFHGLYFKLTN